MTRIPVRVNYQRKKSVRFLRVRKLNSQNETDYSNHALIFGSVSNSLYQPVEIENMPASVLCHFGALNCRNHSDFRTAYLHTLNPFGEPSDAPSELPVVSVQENNDTYQDVTESTPEVPKVERPWYVMTEYGEVDTVGLSDAPP